MPPSVRTLPHPITTGLSPVQHSAMQILDDCKGFPKQSFDAGEIILQEGRDTGVLYVIIDGWVEITKQGVVLNKVSEKGAVFGEISALMGTPHMATVKATEHTR